MSRVPRAKGKRPAFSDHPHVDQLVSMLMALAGEVWVQRERLDTLERLLDRHGPIARADIETFEPDDDVLAAREAERAAFLDRVLWIVNAAREETETDQAYRDLVAALERREGN